MADERTSTSGDELRKRVTLIVALIMIGMWVLGALLAVEDGNTLLKIMTPFTSMILGWLFTAKAAGA